MVRPTRGRKKVYSSGGRIYQVDINGGFRKLWSYGFIGDILVQLGESCRCKLCSRFVHIAEHARECGLTIARETYLVQERLGFHRYKSNIFELYR